MKHLLMIIPFFPPMAGGGVFRPLGFVKNLEKFGWRTTVIAPRPESFWITDPSLLGEIPEGCSVYRTDALSGQYFLSRLRGVRRAGKPPQVRSSRQFRFLRTLGSFSLIPDTYVGWYPFAVREAERLLRAQKFDALYSTSPPETAHLVARRLHRRSGLPWVADFRDPWMNLYLLPTPTALHRRLHARLERAVCTNASVVVATQWHADVLAKKYPEAAVTKIPNGYDRFKLGALSALEPPAEPFQIVHSGMLTQKRTAVPFLRGLRLFLDRHDGASCRAVFLGPRESENDAEVTKLGLDSVVEFRDTVSHEASLKLQRQSHILLLIKHLNPVYQGLVPGKLYEYLGVRRPILALVPDGEARELVEKLRRGETVAQEDPREIAARIGLMYERFRAGTLDRDYNLDAVPEFDRERLTGRLAKHLDALTEAKK